MKPYVNPFDALLAGGDPVAAADAANVIAPPDTGKRLNLYEIAPDYIAILHTDALAEDAARTAVQHELLVAA
jgi:hypothetical protein